MKTPYALFFFALLFFFASCGKDKTIIHGRVVDKDTGLGVKGAVVTFSISTSGTSGGSSFDVLTDSLGHFSYSSEYRVEIFSVLKSGYFSKRTYATEIKEGTENEVIIELLPPNCTLNLKIKHENPQVNNLYFLIYNKSISVEAFPPPNYRYIDARDAQNPLILPVDSIFSKSYLSRSGEYTYFYYDTLPQINGHKLRFKDSVFIAKGETKTFEFNY